MRAQLGAPIAPLSIALPHVPHRRLEAEILVHREPDTGLFGCLDDGGAVFPARREGFLDDRGEAARNRQLAERAMRVLPRDDVDGVELFAREKRVGVGVERHAEGAAGGLGLAGVDVADGGEHGAVGCELPPRVQMVLRVEAAADHPDPDRLRRHRYPATIGVLRMPMPSASISTTSPAFMKICGFWKTPTPAGVPVETMSPGSSGM